MKSIALLSFAAFLGMAVSANGQDPANASSFPVTLTVDAGKPLGPWKPIWRMFGADEPNYATMKDGKKLLAELGEMRPDDVYFRAHNMMSSGDGTPALKWGSTGIYSEDSQGRPVYSWTIVDRIIDTYRERHVHPYLQLGFMPEALSFPAQWDPKLGIHVT